MGLSLILGHVRSANSMVETLKWNLNCSPDVTEVKEKIVGSQSPYPSMMNLHSCAEWIEDGGPRELNTGQTLVWSNAVFGADKSNGGQSRACIEPKSSICCVASNFAHTASYGTPFVSGEKCEIK